MNSGKKCELISPDERNLLQFNKFKPFPLRTSSLVIRTSKFVLLFCMNEIEFIQNTNSTGVEQLIQTSFDWVFWSLMAFNVFAIAYIRTANRGYFSVLFKTGIYNRQLYQNTQEDLRLNGAGSILLTLSYFNCVAIVATYLIPGSEHWLTFVILAGIAAVVFLKYGLIKTLSFVSQTNEGTSEHWINHLIFFQITGVIMTPVLCFSHFSAQSVQNSTMLSLALLVCLMIFIREFQTFIRAIRLRVSPIYIILYLCTLEIIPLVVIIKALVK